MPGVVYLIAVLGGLLFGGADQYLGSIATLGPWAVAVSGMSAPWLALPFAFGLTRRDARHAAGIGLLVTGAALLGYFAMMLSPVEGVTFSHVSLRLELTSQMHVILPGLVTGPFFGLCGWVWRWRRAWGAAALVAGAFALEPLARWLRRLARAGAAGVDRRGPGRGRARRVVHPHAVLRRRRFRLGLTPPGSRPQAWPAGFGPDSRPLIGPADRSTR